MAGEALVRAPPASRTRYLTYAAAALSLGLALNFTKKTLLR